MYLQSLAIYDGEVSSAGLEELQMEVANFSADVYQPAILILQQLGRVADAFNLSERVRARSFLERLGNTHIDVSRTSNSPLIKLEAELKDEIASAQARLSADLDRWQFAGRSIGIHPFALLKKELLRNPDAPERGESRIRVFGECVARNASGDSVTSKSGHYFAILLDPFTLLRTGP
jgi:hypothetical protein